MVTAILLEYLEGNRGVFDGNNDPTMVQVQDVMLLLKNLERGNMKNEKVWDISKGRILDKQIHILRRAEGSVEKVK